MRIIDLSGPLENGMWSYGDPFPEVRIEQATTIGEHGVDTHKITLSSISGTLVETGAHILEDAPTLDRIPLEKLYLDAAVVKVAPKGPREHITLEELRGSGVEVRAGDALLVCTGWDSKWNAENFVLDSPHFELECIDWMLDQDIFLLGGDIPCFDDPREGSLTTELNALDKLYRRGKMILAPVVNLGAAARSRSKLLVLPLKVVGTCSAPARAVLLEDE
ncbi:MAG: cyclase family protein [Candidatus Glassbacteria bacterium]|nr:cyclase family protein [Candidatus Glassbacteria bacterium]